jgi:hypothetical protein
VKLFRPQMKNPFHREAVLPPWLFLPPKTVLPINKYRTLSIVKLFCPHTNIPSIVKLFPPPPPQHDYPSTCSSPNEYSFYPELFCPQMNTIHLPSWAVLPSTEYWILFPS